MALIKIKSCNCVRVTELSEDGKLPVSIHYYDEEEPIVSVEGSGDTYSLVLDEVFCYDSLEFVRTDNCILTESVQFVFSIDAPKIDVSSINFRLLKNFSAIDLTAIEYAGKVYKAKISTL